MTPDEFEEIQKDLKKCHAIYDTLIAFTDGDKGTLWSLLLDVACLTCQFHEVGFQQFINAAEMYKAELQKEEERRGETN